MCIKSQLLLIAFWITSSLFSINPISIEDYQLCHDKELWSVLKANETELLGLQQKIPQDARTYPILTDLALSEQDTLKALTILEAEAINTRNLDAAGLAFNMTQKSHDPILLNQKKELIEKLASLFKDPADNLYIRFISSDMDNDAFIKEVSLLDHYSPEIERDFCKDSIDNIAVERNDSLRINLINRFITQYPHSKWINTARYYRLSGLVNQKYYDRVVDSLLTVRKEAHDYVFLTTALMLDPDVRKNYRNGSANQELLLLAKNAISDLMKIKITDSIQISYEILDNRQWQNRLRFLSVKASYYTILSELNRYGNEDSLCFLLPKKTDSWNSGMKELNSVIFDDNDAGRQAEKTFWEGKYLQLIDNPQSYMEAALAFTKCLILGSPRNRFDKAAIGYLEVLQKKLNVTSDLLDWCRFLKRYNGPIFRDITKTAGLDSINYGRVAFGDFNEDNYPDLLFNGCRLYENKKYLKFENITQAAGLSKYNGNGGLFADFNQDGSLDFVMTSSSLDENGDRLFKNMGNGKFADVNERAGDINDKSPTEGAAWVDRNHDGFPDLYFANYETWNVRDGYPDFFWDNQKSFFHDASNELGFRTPAYTHDHGQAGRGVSPADYDNDGETEIFVSNYRLDRNFLWDWQDGKYVDIAARDGLAGKLKKGYYGHTIGADWGDFDNDGDLDIFIANLAHPRYLDISDKSMLLRNDGKKTLIIGNQKILYNQFTDITNQSGIHYDELHSDPNWFDADNDGDLDLFITSIYENERSYLYLNNGNGTFSDVTWLSGTRVYNGWGNATADIDRDGLLDLCVGSGSGVHLLHNVTSNGYVSVEFQLTWEKNIIQIKRVQIKQPTNNRVRLIGIPTMINSPAFGTRIRVTGMIKNGKPIYWYRELNGGKGTTSQNEEVLHIGLGKANFIREDIIQLKVKN